MTFFVTKVSWSSGDGWDAELSMAFIGLQLKTGARLDFKQPNTRKKHTPYYFEKPPLEVTVDEILACREDLEQRQRS